MKSLNLLNGKDPVPCFDQKKGGVGINYAFKDFNNGKEKKSNFICISLILGNAVLFRFPRKQALRIKGIIMDKIEDDFFITRYYKTGALWSLECNKHIKEIDCELLIKGSFLHFEFHLLCRRL